MALLQAKMGEAELELKEQPRMTRSKIKEELTKADVSMGAFFPFMHVISKINCIFIIPNCNMNLG